MLLAMFGFLNIDKSTGPSSYDVIRNLKRRLPRGTKIGHAGTLDPFAGGVLVVSLGHACRLVEYVQAQPKEYLAVVMLGARSQTDDPHGPIVVTPGANPPADEDVRQALARMLGTILQTPPAHSAVHVQGRRAYELAREGRPADLAPRPVTIHALEMLSYTWPQLELRVTCGSGTYIRSLARDIGDSLGVGGYCEKLTRTRVGPFSLEQARPVEQVDLQRDLISPLAGVGQLRQIQAGDDQILAIRYGQSIAVPDAPGPADAAVVDASGRLLCVGTVAKGHFKPTKVFL